MTLIGGGRILRVCDLCGGVDDGPRHVLAGGQTATFDRPDDTVLAKVLEAAEALDVTPDETARLVRELLDTGGSDRHMTCCRAAGCPDRSCDQLLGDLPDDVDGPTLLEHMTARTEA